LLLLERVPKHAVVDAAVNALKAERSARTAGFANAVLRKVSLEERLTRADAIVRSAPPWLLAELGASVGSDEAKALFGADSDEMPLETRTSIRIVSGKDVPEWLASAELGRVSPRARLVPRSGDLRKRAGYAEGAFVLQEEGAQVIALALGARSGEKVLDACAGRGQKTTLLREQVGASAELWATDLYEEKLRVHAAETNRLGLVTPHTAAVDWTVGAGVVPDGFDRVLVDAPCTGTGTLRRRPEIAARLEPGDPERLGELAGKILRGASNRVKPGGRVVFAVCSVLWSECEAVVEGVKDVLDSVPFDAPELSGLIPADQTMFRLSPVRHGTDGFFIASLRRR
jgi:16S rRNA (cytosine967-C5)-methyltransferase